MNGVRKITACLLIVGFAFATFGFGWSVFLGDYPTVSAPDSASRGSEIAMGGDSNSPGLSITVEDSSGNLLYDSDEDPGATEEGSPEGGSFSLDVTWRIPVDATGPLTVTVEDSLGRTTSKQITLS